jgi:hypothetical protein
MPPLPEAILLMLAPFAPLFSRRVWCHAQRLLLGVILATPAHVVESMLGYTLAYAAGDPGKEE